MDYNGYLLSGDIPIAEIQGGKVIPLDRSLPLYLAAGGSLEDWLSLPMRIYASVMPSAFGTVRDSVPCADDWHRAGHTTQQDFRNL